MRRLLVLAIVLAAAPVLADDDSPGEKGRPADKGALGVGIILGEPTGVTAKLYLQDDQALQAAVGFSLFRGGLHVNADYVFHPWILQERDTFVLPAYIGPGVRVLDYQENAKSEVALDLRVVAGLLFDFKEVPLDAFVEVAGLIGYDFGPGHGFDPALNIAAGARYYF
jgi:hypothetical protein